MKKLLLLLALMTVGFGQMQAQEVYNYLVKKATEKVNSPYTNEYELKKYDFELTALNYIKNYAFKTNRSITTSFLDEQAYNLDCFVLAYMMQMQKTASQDKLKVARAYIDASLNNPLYNDPDTSTTQAYIEEKGSVAPFSLDTDWIKAYQQIKGN